MDTVRWETLFAARRESHTALRADQAEAITRVVAPGCVVDILVGPAGAGKTTTMRTLREVWENQAGRGSVVGLSPSATAARVLGTELGIPTENTAKWLTDHHTRRTAFAKGQLVIVDEASLAGTSTLDPICGHAANTGARVLLVGDWAQLQAVEAGGAFALLAADREDAPTLVDVHRFTREWEKTASLDLRHGRVEAINTYVSHGWVTAGTDEEMRDAAYSAWRADMGKWRASILIAEDRRTVTQLNARAREDRILAR
ncbi:MAG: AAA family ATPase [Bifidobacteriaceae bacterium]|nr:AAA family ATPase [Bifidobacteriaceae bacterium]